MAIARHLILTLGLLLISACAVYMAPMGALPPDQLPPARTVYLDVMADEVTKGEVREWVRTALRRKNVGITLVEHPALADVEVSYQFDDDSHCIDCGPEFNRDWWWSAHLGYKSGEQMTLWGHVQKLRGRPERFFLHQLVMHLQANRQAPANVTTPLPRPVSRQ